MIIPISTFVSLLTFVSLVNGGVIYRGSSHGSLDESGSLDKRQTTGGTAKTTADVPKFAYGTPSPRYPGVVATGKNGPTNPSKPSLGTPVNQTSISRLVSINSVDDWCTFGPKDSSQELGSVEEEVVAYCTKPRNGARIIPDGTVTGAHFVKTPLYVQVMAHGDFTKINFQSGDTGGELDPHGATEKGNPHGGNVTSNVSGKDVFYEEWMNYVGYNIMCFRVCIAGSDIAPPKTECQHTLDEMGCWSVMPGDYSDDVFDTCDADAAYPPGIYVTGGTTSSFQQYATGVWTDDGDLKTFTNGVSTQKTPTTAMSTPSSSNCKKVATIGNGITSLLSPSASGSARIAEVSNSTSGSAKQTSSSKSSSSQATASSQATTSSDTSDTDSQSSTGSSDSSSKSSASFQSPSWLHVPILLAALAVATIAL
ncbi:hypothetical protein MPSI1_001412 [Malassezia psittaci]|uniref:Uncharacterized protein n=1 Tax=Malassezia psittaci TaxID=1821823 RepID=A0AAF0JDA1_9BASI|nr:hypothetical protein MPSI1_001412 [Malassezia psittaci]